MRDELHPSHKTRHSDASSFDEICELCGATDITGEGWGKLAEPCSVKSTLNLSDQVINLLHNDPVCNGRVTTDTIARIARLLHLDDQTGAEQVEQLQSVNQAWSAQSVKDDQRIAVLEGALRGIRDHAVNLRRGTNDWFELVEIEAMASMALNEGSTDDTMV